MSRKLLLKRSYADIVKGADYVADEQERDDEIQIIAEEWANGEPGYVDITPAMCTYGYKKVKEEATNYSYSPIKKKPKKRTTIRTLVRKLPSFDDNWEPEKTPAAGDDDLTIESDEDDILVFDPESTTDGISIADRVKKEKIFQGPGASATASSYSEVQEDTVKSCSRRMDSSSSDESASESSLPSIFKDNKQDDSDSTEDCTMPTFLSKENNMCPILIPDDNDSLQFSLEEKEDYPGMSPSSTKRDAFSEFYQNDRQLPIYKTSNCGIPTKEVVLLLLSDLRDGQISRNIPYTINKNVSFVYNVNDIGHWKNALCDGMGTWDQMGTETVYAAIAGEDDISLFRKKNANTNIKVIRRKYINGSSSDLHRIAITLHDTENNLLNKMFVQYYFIGNEKNIRVKPHGNTRKTEKFERTKETTKDKIKKMCYENKTNKDMFNILIEDEGGLENVKSGSNIARNKKQVANFKLHGKVASDPLLELSELAKDQENSDKRFVRDVRSAPEFTIFLANNRQLNDLERFCTNPDGFSILGIDTTFNIGQYYVTISTYRNMLMLTEKHVEPVMVGPILIHQKKSFDSYFKLTSSIIQEKPSMKDLKVFGTDGDVCLSQACEASFSKAEHLLCDIHMYDNISKKLQSLNIPKDVSKTVLCDIFGIIRHDTKVPGLVDSVTDKEYDEKLSNLTRKWRDLHANGNEFVNYFLEYKSQLVKNCMSASLRSRCGLGCPPNPYTQNANECVNSVIKSDIRHEKGLKSINPYECVAMLEKVVMRQETELKLAVIGKGSWHLKEEYQHLSVPEDEYWNKTNKQREAVHKRVLVEPLKGRQLLDENTSNSANKSSLSAIAFDVGNIPVNTKQKMFKDADKILQNETNIVPVPGTNSCEYYVLDISSNTERRVKINISTSKATCDVKSCHNWNSFKMCSHVIALAEKLDILQSVIQKYRKSPKPVNVTSMVNTNMSARRGQKGTKATSIRKGQANKKEVVLNTYSTAHRKEGTYNELKRESASETKSEPFELTFIQGIIKKCYGCGGIFMEKEREKPYDVILKHLEIRPNFDKDNRKWYIPPSNEKSNAYYHLKADCVKAVHTLFSMDQVTVPLNIQMCLTEDHKRVIQLAGFSFDN